MNRSKLGILILVYALSIITHSTNGKTIYQDNTLWYIGGTLHNASIKLWKSSTAKNKLATCADFVAASKKRAGKQYKTLDEMKRDAIEIMACINETVSGNEKIYNGMKINEIAASCAVLLGI